jgi:hypothetical protein
VEKKIKSAFSPGLSIFISRPFFGRVTIVDPPLTKIVMGKAFMQDRRLPGGVFGAGFFN